MRLSDKIRVLAGAAKYDVSCASSGSDVKRPGAGGMGNVSKGGICHSWTSDGRCVSLLKILMSNDCKYDCAYCVNRRSNNLERTTLTIDELTRLTISFYRRNYIEGLFLSSAVYSTPDQTMEDMIAVAENLRRNHGFRGYIHLKVVPGSARELIDRAGLVADRLSVNIETPSEASLNRLAPQKTRNGILKPMRLIGDGVSHYLTDRRKRLKPPPFAPAGQSTQMIVGASGEHDRQILKLSEGLYNSFSLKRVYYSAYVPVGDERRLPALAGGPPLRREHRLYQADWLFRYYHFNIDELLPHETPSLDPDIDPKAMWALRNFHLFPIDLNTASYEMLLRVPGIGVKSAKRILRIRRVTTIREEDLSKIGLVMKRARYFITIRGRYVADLRLPRTAIKRILIEKSTPLLLSDTTQTLYQPSLFESEDDAKI